MSDPETSSHEAVSEGDSEDFYAQPLAVPMDPLYLVLDLHAADPANPEDLLGDLGFAVLVPEAAVPEAAVPEAAVQAAVPVPVPEAAVPVPVPEAAVLVPVPEAAVPVPVPEAAVPVPVPELEAGDPYRTLDMTPEAEPRFRFVADIYQQLDD